MRKFLTLLASVLTMCLVMVVPCFADDYDSDNFYQNPDTGYIAEIFDDADLLTDKEERSLLRQMKSITEYGDVFFCSTNSNPYSSETYAENICYTYGNPESCTAFLIDMDNREIYIYSEGNIYKTITSGYARSITDNVYSYASDEEYYECAYRAFAQIDTLLGGGSIPQPMKVICNALLSLIMGLTITYFIVRITNKIKHINTSDVRSAIFSQANIINPNSRFIGQTRVYDPPSSSSSGGGGGSRVHHSGGRSFGGGGRSFR